MLFELDEAVRDDFVLTGIYLLGLGLKADLPLPRRPRAELDCASSLLVGDSGWGLGFA